MRCTITGRDIKVTPGLRDTTQDKIGKLDRYFNPDTEVIVTLSVQKNKQNIEVAIPVKENIIRAGESSNDIHVSIDLIGEIIRRQTKRYKTKLIDKKQVAQSFSELFINEEPTAVDEEIGIVKTGKFVVKPMNPKEACLQMELLRHNFYVFLNSDTDQVSIVYKRKNNTYGLIEPGF